MPDADLERAIRTVLQALVRTLDDKNGRWVFSPAHREARSELALTGIADSRLTNVVIDRTFIDEKGVRWVIDFKTSRHEGAALRSFSTASSIAIAPSSNATSRSPSASAPSLSKPPCTSH